MPSVDSHPGTVLYNDQPSGLKEHWPPVDSPFCSCLVQELSAFSPSLAKHLLQLGPVILLDSHGLTAPTWAPLTLTPTTSIFAKVICGGGE